MEAVIPNDRNISQKIIIRENPEVDQNWIDIEDDDPVCIQSSGPDGDMYLKELNK